MRPHSWSVKILAFLNILAVSCTTLYKTGKIFFHMTNNTYKDGVMLHTSRSIVRVFFFLTLLTALILLAPAPDAKSGEGNGKTVAVLPFTMHAPSSLAYLQDGLRDMLASRLAANGGATIVERSKIDALLQGPAETMQQEPLAELARQLGADFIVTGSLTSLGGSMSLDAKVFSRDGSVEPQTFYASAPQENEVIGAINSLSWDISEKVLEAARPSVPSPAVAAQPVPAPQDAAMTAFKTEHPDKMIRSQAMGRTAGIGSPFILNQGLGGIRGFTKTQNFDFVLRAMDMGDVDGDGNDDLVLADTDKIHIYSFTGSRQQELGAVSLAANERVHGVSVADLDGNGRAEIYVSANDNDTPVSFGLEWQDNAFRYIFRRARWYVRVLDIPGEGPTLAGQKGYSGSPAVPGIYRLHLNGDSLQHDSKLLLPENINLFDFSMADLNSDGVYEIIALTQQDDLVVLSTGGSLIWKSPEYYGGSTRYIGELDSSKGRLFQTNEIVGKRIFVPGRIIVADINNDNLPDVLVSRNISTASRFLQNFKSYSSSEIHALTWNGIGLTELWHTKKIDGYVPDYQLRTAKSDQGDQAMLYVGVALQGGTMEFLAGRESTVLMYNLTQVPGVPSQDQ